MRWRGWNFRSLMATQRHCRMTLNNSNVVRGLCLIRYSIIPSVDSADSKVIQVEEALSASSRDR